VGTSCGFVLSASRRIFDHLRFVASVLLGVGLAAAPLVTLISLVSGSRREAGFSITESLSHSVHPVSLLQAFSTYRATLSWLPNFAYNFSATRVRDRDLEGLDLSSMRAFVNCSEPMRAASHRMFVDRFAAFGVRAAMMTTCYAMAENVFAVTQGGMGAPVVIDRPLARAMREERQARLSEPGDAAETVEMLSAGRPIDGVALRIVDDGNRPLAERGIGEICLRSNAMMTGYYHRDDATQSAIRCSSATCGAKLTCPPSVSTTCHPR